MIIVNLKGGPKRVTFINETARASWIDFENPDGRAKRVIIEAGERKDITVRIADKYVTCINPPGVRMIAVEELGFPADPGVKQEEL